MEEKGWEQEFIDLFDKALLWERQLHTDAEKTYRLSKEYAKRKDYPEKWQRKTRKYISNGLLRLAKKMGYPGARFDDAQDDLSKERKRDKSMGLYTLRNLALENYIPAQKDLSDRYLAGKNIERNLVRAFYWLTRLGLNGIDVIEQLKELESRLTDEQKQEVVRWLTLGKPPF